VTKVVYFSKNYSNVSAETAKVVQIIYEHFTFSFCCLPSPSSAVTKQRLYYSLDMKPAPL